MKPLINEEQNKQQKTILKKENILLRLLWVLNPRIQNTILGFGTLYLFIAISVGS